MTHVFLKDLKKTPKAAIFLSGSGSNAEKLLESYFSGKERNSSPAWEPSVIVTDRPKTSSAEYLAKKSGIPFLGVGILDFYRANGLEKVSLDSEKAREVREKWTDLLREKLKPFAVDFGLFAGFVPLSNIVGDFPCLNVHPGDLTVEKNGMRRFVGLHSIPVELAMLEGDGFMRASVILVQPYSEAGGGMDSGHILGISGKVAVDYEGHSAEELKQIYISRKGPHHHGSHKDLLFELALKNQEKLKKYGDWVIYSRVAEDFAGGCFAEDDDGSLLYRKDPSGEYHKIRTVEYSETGRDPVF